MSENKGWECPKCGKTYAPHVDECKHCNGTSDVSPLPIPQLPPMPYIPPTIAPQPIVLPTITSPNTFTKWPNYPLPYVGDWPIDPPYKVTCGTTTSSITATLPIISVMYTQ